MLLNNASLLLLRVGGQRQIGDGLLHWRPVHLVRRGRSCRSSSRNGARSISGRDLAVLMRAHRPDLARDRTEAEVLDLRRDPSVAREITARFTERNANVQQPGCPLSANVQEV